MKRYTSRWQYWVALLVSIFLIACEQRDPEAEFQKILDTPYYNVKEGIIVLDDYINYFSQKSSPHMEEVYKMRREYNAMEKLFNDSYQDYVHFMEVINLTQHKGEDSEFASVREVWRQLFNKKKHTLLDPDLEKLDKKDFIQYMSEDAKKMCNKHTSYVDKVFMTPVECLVLEMCEPQLTEDGFSKTCEGTFKVNSEGKLLGVFDSTAKIKLKGMIVGDSIPSFQYRLIDYEILESSSKDFENDIKSGAQMLIKFYLGS